MKTFLGVLSAVVLGALIIYFVPPFHAKAADILSYSQCDTATPYKIGSIDPRFNLSLEEAQQDIAEAADVWSSAKGKSLFVSSPKAALTINFEYDQRQALDNQITQLDTKLKTSGQSLKQQKTAYEADVRAFKQKLQEFDNTVDRYNSQGGAPKEVYDELIKQQKQLQAEGEALNKRAEQLNVATQNYNGSVATLNQDINQFNSAIAQKPEEGLYDGSNDTITIYFANNHDELIHTLTHELGHALGMVHVGDERAIMFPYTTGYDAVTEYDLRQLAYVCRDQSVFLHYFQVFDRWLIDHAQNLKQALQKNS